MERERVRERDIGEGMTANESEKEGVCVRVRVLAARRGSRQYRHPESYCLKGKVHTNLIQASGDGKNQNDRNNVAHNKPAGGCFQVREVLVSGYRQVQAQEHAGRERRSGAQARVLKKTGALTREIRGTAALLPESSAVRMRF